MKKATTISLLFLLVLFITSCSTRVIFSTSEKDARIFVDGKPRGSGQSSIVKVYKDQCVRVKAEKTVFLTEEFDYCFTGYGYSFGEPRREYIELSHDDAYDASIITDYANKDFEVTVSKELTEMEAWKVISQVVTGYFDNLEMSDKATGYMKTSWQSKSFSQKTVRSRIIVKQSATKPLKYKIKIISEYSDTPNQSVKNDDNFKEWDRILRAYDELVTEFQTRLGRK